MHVVQRTPIATSTSASAGDGGQTDTVASSVQPPRHLLAVAFHFPPIQASSGVHRLLAFARYLPQHGWQTSVITAHPRAYAQQRAENLGLIPPGTQVIRAAAWDTKRHFSIGGRYLQTMALPDRWQSWILPAFVAGLRATRRQHFDAILTTFPIASAHAVGLLLHRATGLPWIADFRDPMVQERYPTDARTWRNWDRLERAVFAAANAITVTTDRTRAYYARRYGDPLASKVTTISNGFDPEVFPTAPDPSPPRAAGDGPLTLLHSGVMYPSERNPVPFFRAVAALKAAGDPAVRQLRILFRDSGHDERYQETVRNLGLQDAIQFLPSLPYHEAVAEMLQVDGLLVFQSADCESQIPAKVYEYLYAGRPIVGIVHPDGDTADLLRQMNVPAVAALEDEAAIGQLLRSILPVIRGGHYPLPDRATVMTLSRRARTTEFAVVLDGVLARHGATVSEGK